MIINQTPDTVLVDLEDLTVDPRVQQPLVESRVKDILSRGFNLVLFGLITVSVREDNTTVVLDGQHRSEAGRRAGHKDKVQAHAYYGLTLAEEAYLFVYLNKKANPGALAKFMVRAVAGEEAPVGITRILSEYDWQVGQSGGRRRKGFFAAVGKAENIYTGKGAFKAKHPGPWIFELAVSTITDAWGMQTDGVTSEMIGGVSLFLVRFVDRIDAKDLVRVLGRTTPTFIAAEATQLKSVMGLGPDAAVGYLIHREYNKGRRSGKLVQW